MQHVASKQASLLESENNAKGRCQQREKPKTCNAFRPAVSCDDRQSTDGKLGRERGRMCVCERERQHVWVSDLCCKCNKLATLHLTLPQSFAQFAAVCRNVASSSWLLRTLSRSIKGVSNRYPIYIPAIYSLFLAKLAAKVLINFTHTETSELVHLITWAGVSRRGAGRGAGAAW